MTIIDMDRFSKMPGANTPRTKRLDSLPSRQRIRTRKIKVPERLEASEVFSTDRIEDLTGVARMRIIRAFADTTDVHRHVVKSRGYITGIDGPTKVALVNYVSEICEARPFIHSRELPKAQRKLSSGKKRKIVHTLQRELIELALEPLLESQGIFYQLQDGGVWQIRPSCLDELYVARAMKRHDIKETAA